MHERQAPHHSPREVGIAILVLSVVALTSVALRMASKRMTTFHSQADDYLILLATPLMLASAGLTVFADIDGAVGRHVTDVGVDRVEVSLKCLFIIILLYPIVVALVKSSTLWLYYHLFGVRREFRIQCAVTLVVIWSWAASVVCSTLFICTPIAFNWNPELPAGRCGHQDAFYIAGGVTNTMTDVIVMVLPIPHIWSLQMPVGQRVAVSSVFALGTLVAVIGVIRIPAIVRIDYRDITFTVRWPLLWTMVEEQLAVICANLLVGRPIFARIIAAGLPCSWKLAPDGQQGGIEEGWEVEHRPTARTEISVGRFPPPRRSRRGRHVTGGKHLAATEALAGIRAETEIAVQSDQA